MVRSTTGFTMKGQRQEQNLLKLRIREEQVTVLDGISLWNQAEMEEEACKTQLKWRFRCTCDGVFVESESCSLLQTVM